MKTMIYLSTSALVVLGAALPAFADGLEAPVTISEILAMKPAEEVRICTGAEGGAYFQRGALLAGAVSASAGIPAIPFPGGGTLGCLDKLAKGEVEAAFVQGDALAWLQQTRSPLLRSIGVAGKVLTEEVVVVCNRSVNEEDFGDVGQSRDFTVVVGGGPGSGANLMLNVIADFDSDFAKPTYLYADPNAKNGFLDAVGQVSDGLADCAVGVMDIHSPIMKTVDDEFGNSVRMIGAWDGDFRSLEFNREQVYGWRTIAKDTPNIETLLDWYGNGRTYAYDTVAQTALVIYRKDIPDAVKSALDDSVSIVASLKDDVQD